MKIKSWLVIVLLMSSAGLNGQVKNPVEWKFSSQKMGDVVEVVAKATIKSPWHIYSQNTGKGGPIATKFTFNKNPLLSLTGSPKESGKLEKVYDKFFSTDVLFYAGEVVFKQAVKVKKGVKTNLSGTVEYMVCDEEQCLPPVKKTFDVSIEQ